MVFGRIREGLAAFASDLGREAVRQHRGDASAEGWAAVVRRHPLLVDQEAYLAARDHRAAAGAGSEKARSAGRVEAFLARAVALARCAGPLDEAFAAEGSASATLEGEEIGLRGGSVRIAAEPVRERRAALARAWPATFRAVEAPLCRAAEARTRVAAALGFADEAALTTASEGLDVAARAEDAQAVLRATADGFDDLTAYLRRREVGRLPRRAPAEWHDLLRAMRAPRLDGHFRPADAVPLARRTAEEAGLARPLFRTEIDASPAPSRAAGACVALVSLPGRVEASLRLEGGPADLVHAFDTVGRAMALAAADPDADAADRWLLPPAWLAAWGAVWRRVPIDPLWHRRALRAKSTVAIEAARGCAVRALFELRLAAAAVRTGAALARLGPTAAVREVHRDAFAAAARSTWPTERWIADAWPWREAAEALAGEALSHRLCTAAREACNQDWWRNPSAGRVLGRWLARGGWMEPTDIAKEAGQPAPSLLESAEALVRAAAM